MLPKAGKTKAELNKLIKQIKNLECGMAVLCEYDDYICFGDPDLIEDDEEIFADEADDYIDEDYEPEEDIDD